MQFIECILHVECVRNSCNAPRMHGNYAVYIIHVEFRMHGNYAVYIIHVEFRMHGNYAVYIIHVEFRMHGNYAFI